MANEPVWAKRPEPNHTGETAFTRCDCCRHLSCIPQQQSRLHMYAYYCHAMSRRMTINELRMVTRDECPEHRDIKRRFR